MRIEFNLNKQVETLDERGLDFAQASQVFAGKHLTLEDTRQDYDEQRFHTAGLLDGRMVVLVWTPRG